MLRGLGKSNYLNQNSPPEALLLLLLLLLRKVSSPKSLELKKP